MPHSDSLRLRVVEAGARAIRQRVLPRGMERLATDAVIVQTFKDAEAALDAMLDCLAENADEWDRTGAATFDDYPALRAKSFTYNLIATLREDR